MAHDPNNRSATRIVFAAGGTGGHIYPALAVAEALRAERTETDIAFLCSDRAIDARVMGATDEAWTATSAKPFGVRPLTLARFARHWGRALRACRAALREADALVVTGGFVSAPAARAARLEGVPVVLLNLDAVPGKASRLIAPRAHTRLTASHSDATPSDWERLPPVVREGICSPADPGNARGELGLDRDRPTLLITGGSQGARSLNELIEHTLEHHPDAFAGHQVLHQAGEGDATIARLEQAYARAGVPAHVVGFLDRMDLAWGASDAAITRAGAGAVGEAWATRTPALFLPYPFHADDHQRVNAQVLVEASGALMVDDKVQASETCAAFVPALERLTDRDARIAMRNAIEGLGPADGAARVARRVFQIVS